MKHYLLLPLCCILAITTYACQTKEDTDYYSEEFKTSATSITKVPNTLNKESFDVSNEEADYLANLFAPEKKIISAKVLETEGIATLHIYEYECGWVAIPGDKRFEPFIAFNKKGSLTESSMQMINNISTCIAATKRSNLAGNEDNLCKWTSLLPPMISDDQEDNNILTKASAPEKKWALFYVGSSYQSQEVERIDHLIQTQWNEDSPWNSKFPLRTENTHNLVSSMAVLTSELLYCLHCNIGKPTKMYHSVSYFPSESSNYFVYSTDLNTTSNRWNQLPLSSSTTTQYTEYVSSLMLDVSGILDANYSGNGSSLPNAVLTRYGLTFSNSSYNSVNVYTSIHNHTPVFCNIQGHNYNYTITSNQISLIDGYLETESWTSQDYYANYTANYRGAYKVFDSEAEFRAYVGNSYQVGTLWSIRTGYTTSEYILLAHDDSYFSINSMPSNTTNTNNLTLQSTIVYNIH